MKRLLILLLLALATPAAAQNVVYRPLSGFSFLITTTEATSPRTLLSQTRIARVLCSVSCHVAFPVSPVVMALTNAVPMYPGREEYFRVTPGTVVYVRTDTGGGRVYVSEME